jgi:sterol desaturase/sphingolipid hydroxylase (fatty acid hydroxylase superfamily)
MLLAAALIALHLGRYFLMAGGAYLFFWSWKGNPLTASRRIQPDAFEPSALRREVFASIGTALIFGLFFGVAFSGLKPTPLVHSGLGAVLEFFAWLGFLLVLHDTYFYWSHRLAHHALFFRRVHALHHQSRNPSPFAALAFQPTEAVLQVAWAVPVGLLLPVPSAVWFVFSFVAMFINVLGHCNVELYPRTWSSHPVMGWLNSSTMHNRHHQRLDRNFGLYFTLWDRLMKTQA